VKIVFIKQFGSEIDFTYSAVLCKSMMAFSVPNNAANVSAEYLHTVDPVQVCASVIGKSLMIMILVFKITFVMLKI
jgi:hypothetical protein